MTTEREKRSTPIEHEAKKARAAMIIAEEYARVELAKLTPAAAQLGWNRKGRLTRPCRK